MEKLLFATSENNAQKNIYIHSHTHKYVNSFIYTERDKKKNHNDKK